MPGHATFFKSHRCPASVNQLIDRSTDQTNQPIKQATNPQLTSQQRTNQSINQPTNQATKPQLNSQPNQLLPQLTPNKSTYCATNHKNLLTPNATPDPLWHEKKEHPDMSSLLLSSSVVLLFFVLLPAAVLLILMLCRHC